MGEGLRGQGWKPVFCKSAHFLNIQVEKTLNLLLAPWSEALTILLISLNLYDSCDISRLLITEEQCQDGHQDTLTNSSQHRRHQGDDVSEVVLAPQLARDRAKTPCL